MLLQTIISQNNQLEQNLNQDIVWNASLTGDYTNMPTSVTKALWIPTTDGVETYNHHPFMIEFGGFIHAMHSTGKSSEEEPGQYTRYTKSNDEFDTKDTYKVIFEPQDDYRDYTLGGRICQPAGFVIVDGELYALADVNDRGTGTVNRSRTGVGILARKINMDGTFGVVYWIENIDGTLTAPPSLPGFPVYAFDSLLRTKIRDYLIINANDRTDWYFSVPPTDFLFTILDNWNGTSDWLAEPRVVQLPDLRWLKLWRGVGSVQNRKIAQFSDYGTDWGTPFISGIPDAPSRTAVLRCRNTNIAVIGNNDPFREHLFFALSADGLTYNSANVYNIDTELSGVNFSGDGKAGGAQYPHSIELNNGKIAVIFSRAKEDIKIAFFTKPTIV